MKVIFHNDDFGLTYGFADAIVNSHKKGLTTSTSIRTNGFAFKYAADLSKSLKNLGVGLHFNVTEGPTHLEALANTEGRYKHTFAQYYFLLKNNKKLLKHISDELIVQIEMALKAGVKIDHIDSQDHIHMIPPIFELVCKNAKKYGISNVRLTKEPWHATESLNSTLQPFFNTNAIKWYVLRQFSQQNIKTLANYKLSAPAAFYGTLRTNNMDKLAIMDALKHALKNNYPVIEILSHPAYPDTRDIVYTSPFIKNYANLNSRIIEAKALQSEELKKFLVRNSVERVTYKDISKD